MSRLKELVQELCPSGVEYKPLGEVGVLEDYVANGSFASLKANVTYMTQPDYAVLVRVADYTSGFNSSKFKYVNKHAYNYLSKSSLNPGDIVISSVGSIGVVFRCPDLGQPMTLGPNSIVLKSEISDYLYHYLNSFEGQRTLLNLSGQGTLPKINKTQLRKIRIPVPPIEVQREVVRILDSFQELDDALTAEIEAREKLFETCLSTLIGSLTEDATTVKLGSQMSIVRGASPRPIKSFLTNSSDGVHWIKIGDVGVGGKFVTDTAEYVTPAGAAKSRFLKRGSLILSNSMSFGRPYILEIEGCIHDGWLAMSDYESSYDRDFLYYLLRSDGVQTAWDMAASTSTVRNLNADIVRDTLVPLPSMDKQLEVAGALDEVMALTNVLRSERDARRSQFEYYRDKLLSFPERVS